jgi:hypothetical protein
MLAQVVARIRRCGDNDVIDIHLRVVVNGVITVGERVREGVVVRSGGPHVVGRCDQSEWKLLLVIRDWHLFYCQRISCAGWMHDRRWIEQNQHSMTQATSAMDEEEGSAALKRFDGQGRLGLLFIFLFYLIIVV